jgi:hypothetical protein
LKITGFDEMANGVYTREYELVDGWPYYRGENASHCISYDTGYNHWWLQHGCLFLGNNVGEAWLDGQQECPHHCSHKSKSFLCS